MISTRSVTRLVTCAAFGLSVICATAPGRAASPAPAVKEEDGKYFDKEGDPTYNVKEDGTVDWYTYNGFRRYHSECHVCHGPDGEGSSYAPALKKSLQTMSYGKFLEIVAVGIKQVNVAENLVMPGFGDNKSVTCYMDDIYVYLKARSDEAIPRGRPQKRADKPETAKQAEEACLK